MIDKDGADLWIDLGSHWDLEEGPLLEGVFFSDGTAKLMATSWQQDQEEHCGISVEQREWTTLAELAARGELDWTDACEECEAIAPDLNIRAVAGSGSYGSDGFVAVVCTETGQLKWLAFFTGSNPFEEVTIVGDQVRARSTHGTWWHFPLDAPYNVTLHD